MAGYRKLGRTSDQRKAMLRSLTTAIIVNGKIVTTEARAKEVRKEVEHLIALDIAFLNIKLGIAKGNYNLLKVTELRLPTV